MSKLSRIGLCFVVGTLNFATAVDRSSSPDLSFVISGMNIEWPGANAKNIYKTSGHYEPRNIIATRSQIYKDEAIVVFPRYKSGVPFTLGIAKLSKKGRYVKPNIAPFPCWSLQEEGNCEALQNAVDIVIDEQEVIWILDVGITNTLENSIRRCPPKIVAINMKSHKVIDVIDLSKWVESTSRLQYLVVHRAKDGRIFLYVSDAETRAIIGYDVASDRGYRYLLPSRVTLGCTDPDVLYLNLARRDSGTAFLFVTYLGGKRMFSIDAENLHSNDSRPLIVDLGTKERKMIMLGTDNYSGIYFRNAGQSDIYTWNVNNRFTTENFILVQKGNEYRSPTQVFRGYRRNNWVLESNFRDFIQNTVGCGGASVILHPIVKSVEYL